MPSYRHCGYLNVQQSEPSVVCLFNFQCYLSFLNVQGSIGPLMGILSDHLVAMDKTDMTGYQQQAVAFFLVALDYRTKYADVSCV